MRNLFHNDLKQIKGVLPNEYFDVVSINPPYKKVGTGIVNEKEDYKNARHEFNCTLYDAAKAANYLLKFGGRYCMCQRPERLPEMFDAMKKNKIEPKINTKREPCSKITPILSYFFSPKRRATII